MDDRWKVVASGNDQDLKSIQQEYDWSVSHSSIRDYMLAEVTEEVDPLNDSIPF